MICDGRLGDTLQSPGGDVGLELAIPLSGVPGFIPGPERRPFLGCELLQVPHEPFDFGHAE